MNDVPQIRAVTDPRSAAEGGGYGPDLGGVVSVGATLATDAEQAYTSSLASRAGLLIYEETPMARIRSIRTAARAVSFLTEFAEQSDSLVIPEDLTTVDAGELATLRESAVEAFNAIYQNGEADLSEEDLSTMQDLATALEALNAEIGTREASAQERRDAALALSSSVNPDEGASAEADADTADEDEEDAEEDDTTDEGAGDTLVAGAARRELRVNLGNLRGRRPVATVTDGPSISDYAFASTEAGGSNVGAPMDFLGMGRSIDSRLRSFNVAKYASAAKSGRAVKHQFGVATLNKPYGDLMLRSDSPSETERVINLATDQSALPGGSLVASGGWCAPSETIYDVYDCGEVADGLLSIPTIGVSRGGVRFNRGVNFNELLTQSGFFYTEAEDIAGDYDGEGAGSKPCFKIDCVDFVEERLELDGLCLTAGLLQSKGYPEVIADATRKALIAHEIRMDSRRIAKIVAGSTAVAMPAGQVGAAAPLLTAIELQAQHYRASGSLSDNTVLEGIFPQWIRGVIRSDLSRRLGVDLLSVSNAQINGWFADRLIAPQYVANWQSVSGTAAAAFNAWPTTATFLLYKAGTWVGANSEVITLDGLYDSTLVGTNDYTALFTEEGTMTLKRGCDSRAVTVPICPDGATHAGVDIACDGSLTPVV